MASLLQAIFAVVVLVGCGSAPEPIITPPALAPTASAQFPAGVEQRTTVFQGATRTYFLYIPPNAGIQPLPTLILHHGTGGTGLELINAWLNTAARERMILIAPKGEHGFGWMVPDDGPMMQIQIVEDLRQRSVPIDPRRMYLFGYSNGGDFVLYAAIQQSKYFAAAAIHSAALRPRQFPMLDIAERKIPLWYSAGTEDMTFTIQEARATVQALQARSWPLDYVERVGQGHAYIPGDSNPLIWAFLRDKSLPSDPVPTPMTQQWLSFALR